MADFDGVIDPAAEWADIPQLSVDAIAMGGASGAMNAQAIAIAKRLNLLKTIKVNGGEVFPVAPVSFELFLKLPDQQLYYYDSETLSWEFADAALQALLAAHIEAGSATDNVHGLRGITLALGSGSSSTASGSLAIGWDASSAQGASSAVGRSCTISGEGSANHNYGSSNSIAGSLSTHQYTTVYGVSNVVSDCSTTNVIGHINNISGMSNSNIIGRANTIVGGSYNIRLGNGDVLGDNCVDCIAIGRGGSIANNLQRAVAIGYGATASANDQVVIGNSSATTHIPGGLSVAGTKSFQIPHPAPGKEETHTLQHNSYEGPVEGGTIYRYSVTVLDGTATLDLPDYFQHLNKDEGVWCQAKKHFGIAFGEIEGNTLTVTASADGEYLVLVLGTRKDAAVQGWLGAERAVS